MCDKLLFSDKLCDLISNQKWVSRALDELFMFDRPKKDFADKIPSTLKQTRGVITPFKRMAISKYH